MCMHVCTLRYTAGQRTAWESQFFSATMFTPETKLRSLGLHVFLSANLYISEFQKKIIFIFNYG